MTAVGREVFSVAFVLATSRTHLGIHSDGCSECV